MLGMFEAGLFPGVNYYLSWSVSPPINVIKSTTFRNSSLLLRDLKVTMKTFSRRIGYYCSSETFHPIHGIGAKLTEPLSLFAAGINGLNSASVLLSFSQRQRSRVHSVVSWP